MSSTIAQITVTVTATAVASTVTATVTAVPVPAPPIYFETCWSILSVIGLFNTLVGFLVIGIIGFSYLALIPIIASIGSAVSNGLCYITFYSNRPNDVKVVTSGVEDMMWIIAEIMIPIYSGCIVRVIVRGRERIIHHIVFAFLVCTMLGCSFTILAIRLNMFENEPYNQRTINMLHVGRFVSTALSEIWNAYFLIKKFIKAEKRRDKLRIGFNADDKHHHGIFDAGPATFNLFSLLARSTEIRCSALATVGIMRAVTFSFQMSAASATNTASQVDRFAASLGHLLPIILYIDLVASKLAYQIDRNQSGYAGTSDTTGSTHRSKSLGWSSSKQPKGSEINAEEGRRATWADTISNTPTAKPDEITKKEPAVAAAPAPASPPPKQ